MEKEAGEEGFEYKSVLLHGHHIQTLHLEQEGKAFIYQLQSPFIKGLLLGVNYPSLLGCIWEVK